MYFWTIVQTILKNESLQTVSVTSPAHIDNKLNEREIVRILMQKYIRRVKSYWTLKHLYFFGQK